MYMTPEAWAEVRAKEQYEHIIGELQDSGYIEDANHFALIGTCAVVEYACGINCVDWVYLYVIHGCEYEILNMNAQSSTAD
jgi:hypothetical protein